MSFQIFNDSVHFKSNIIKLALLVVVAPKKLLLLSVSICLHIIAVKLYSTMVFQTAVAACR